MPHIVIIGGGIIGVSAAYYLLTSPKLPPHTRVTLIENVSIAAAASGRAAGFIARESSWHAEGNRELADLSYGLFRELAAKFDGVERFGWREFEAATGVIVGQDQVAMSEYRSLPQSKGAAAYVGPRTPWVNGSTVDVSGLGKGQMAQVLPLEFTQTLHEQATSRGLETLYATPHSRSNHTLYTSQGAVHYDKLIIAAGPWSPDVCRTLDLPVVPVSTLPGHSILLKPGPLPSGYDGVPPAILLCGVGVEDKHFAPGNHQEANGEELEDGWCRTIEYFPRPDGTVYAAGENGVPAAIGRADIDTRPNRLPRTAADVKHLVDQRLVDRMLNSSRAVSESFDIRKDAKLVKADLCYRPVCEDKQPIIGEWVRDVYVSAGHGPWGITLAPGSGLVLAELITEDLNGERGRAKLSADISLLDPHRFETGAKL